MCIAVSKGQLALKLYASEYFILKYIFLDIIANGSYPTQTQKVQHHKSGMWVDVEC